MKITMIFAIFNLKKSGETFSIIFIIFLSKNTQKNIVLFISKYKYLLKILSLFS